MSKAKPYCLPEVTVVEYLLSTRTSVLEDLRNYIDKFNAVPSINFYNGNFFLKLITNDKNFMKLSAYIL